MYNTKRKLAAEQHRKTDSSSTTSQNFIYVPWDCTNHIEFIPLSNYSIHQHVFAYICVCVSMCIRLCVLDWGAIRLSVHSYMVHSQNKRFVSLLSHLMSPTIQHRTDVFALLLTSIRVFLFLAKNYFFIFAFHLCKNLQVSTWFFQVNQKLANSLDWCNHSTTAQ